MAAPENVAGVSGKHYISESDSDSDKTVSEDELTNLIASGKYKQISASNNSVEIINEKEMNPKVDKNLKPDIKPQCKYGADCYRKNPQHLKDYSHPRKRNIDPSTDSAQSVASVKKAKTVDNIGFYMTTVHGISSTYNQNNKTIGIKDILSKDMGNLIESAQFNYMFEIPWLLEQYPKEFRNKPLLIVHGEQREAKRALEQQVAPYSNISLCQAPLEIMFGTHHTKMMFLLYENGLRIVIHTSNLIKQDWYQKSQGVWASPVFPKLDGPPSILKGDSETFFKRDLIEYLTSYRARELNSWCDHIKSHNLSSARVYLIGSVPGRHSDSRKMLFGHLKLKKVLSDKGPNDPNIDKKWPVIGQFSSIGSLGPNPNQWLTKEWLSSLSSTKKSTNVAVGSENLKLIFPCVNDVRLSLEGYPAGGSLPYSIKTAQKQPWLRNFLHVWRSKVHGRTNASPHIKTYLRVSPDHKKIAWMLITSANLSKAAWGALEKQDTQLMIRSYEMGVLFLPNIFNKDYFEGQTSSSEYFVPFDIPPTPYSANDQPWMWDVPHTEAPDRHGMMWKPN